MSKVGPTRRWQPPRHPAPHPALPPASRLGIPDGACPVPCARDDPAAGRLRKKGAAAAGDEGRPTSDVHVKKRRRARALHSGGAQAARVKGGQSLKGRKFSPITTRISGLDMSIAWVAPSQPERPSTNAYLSYIDSYTIILCIQYKNLGLFRPRVSSIVGRAVWIFFADCFF